MKRSEINGESIQDPLEAHDALAEDRGRDRATGLSAKSLALLGAAAAVAVGVYTVYELTRQGYDAATVLSGGTIAAGMTLLGVSTIGVKSERQER